MWNGPHPACGHSLCSQAFIDSGDPRCIDPDDSGDVVHLPPRYRLPSDRVGTAFAIRNAIPSIGLSDALLYADASTVQGRAFRSSGGGFYGTGYDRHTIAFGYAWYAMTWGPCPDSVDRRLRRMKVRLSCTARLANETPEVRRCYGAIVRSRHAWWIAFERFCRRAKKAGREVPTWPGMWNLPYPEDRDQDRFRAWLASEGIDYRGVESYAPPDRGEAYSCMQAHLRECVSYFERAV